MSKQFTERKPLSRVIYVLFQKKYSKQDLLSWSQWYAKNTFSISPSSLTWFRITLGIIICINVMIRFFDLEAHYGTNGITSIQYLKEAHLKPGQWSLFFLNPQTYFQAFLLFITGISGLLLAIGYKTKYIKWFCFLLITSLNMRNPYIINSGDSLLRILLFWSLFLNFPPSIKNNSSLTILGYKIQIALVYWGTIVMRSGSDIWHEQKTGVYYALNIDQFTTPLGDLIRNGPPQLLFLMNDMTMFLELWGPVMFFIPYPPIQIITLLCLMIMHISFSFTMNIGLFGIISVAALIPLLFLNKPPSETKPKSSKYNTILISTIITLMLWWNLGNIKLLTMPLTIQPLVRSIGLAQEWRMFSPHPPLQDGWFQIRGIDNSNKTHLLWPEYSEKISDEKPIDVSQNYKNQRWRKFFMNLTNEKHKENQKHLLTYFCDKYQDKNLKSLKLLYFLEKTPPINQPIEKTKKEILEIHECNN